MAARGKNFPVFRVCSSSVLKVARLCLGSKFEKQALSNGCRPFTALKPLQSCDFVPKASPRTSVTPVFLLTKEESHKRKTGRFLNIFTAVRSATAFTCVFLSESVVQAAWEESQGKLTEMRLKRKWKIDNQIGAIRAKKLNKQDTCTQLQGCDIETCTEDQENNQVRAKKYGATAFVDYYS